MHHLFVPLCFGTKSVPTADTDLDSRIFPFSSNCFLTSRASSRLNRRCFALGNFAPSRIRIAKSYGPCSGNRYFSLQKTSENSCNSFGSLVSTSCSFCSYSLFCLSGPERVLFSRVARPIRCESELYPPRPADIGSPNSVGVIPITWLPFFDSTDRWANAFSSFPVTVLNIVGLFLRIVISFVLQSITGFSSSNHGIPNTMLSFPVSVST